MWTYLAINFNKLKVSMFIKCMGSQYLSSNIREGKVQVILASPEAIMLPPVMKIIHSKPLSTQLCLQAFDEAHCISEWYYHIILLNKIKTYKSVNQKWLNVLLKRR